jgi:anti-anti-sigma regulatory factor
LRDAPTAIVVDVSGVDRLDGDGVMLLIRMRRQARRLGPTLPLAGVAPTLARSLRMFDPNGLFGMHATASEAIRACAARSMPGPRRRLRAACAERGTTCVPV